MQINVGIITVSDRASKGLYDDLGGPAVKKAAEGYGWKVLADALVPDEKSDIQRAVREQIAKGCELVLTTGGTRRHPRGSARDCRARIAGIRRSHAHGVHENYKECDSLAQPRGGGG